MAALKLPKAFGCKCQRGNEKSESPDGRYQAVLEVAGRIECGPPYFHLRIDDLNFGGRIFGDTYLWSNDSVFFVIQEWLTQCYKTGPRTALTLLNLSERKECRVSWADKGFIIPLVFFDNVLIYKKEYLDRGIVKEFEIDFRSLSNWEEIRVESQLDLVGPACDFETL